MQTKPKKQKTIDIRDALQLEEYDQVRFLNGRTRRAIHDTYGPKSPTKKRRKLPGKRSWKDKKKQYQKLEGQMTVNEFNHKSRASKIIQKIFTERQKQEAEEAAARNRHMLHGDE